MVAVCLGVFRSTAERVSVSNVSVVTDLYSIRVQLTPTPPEIVRRRKILHSTYVQYVILHLW